jgi:hypothetical protein
VRGRFVCRGDHRLGLVSIRVFLMRALAPFRIAFELQQPFCEVVRVGVATRRRRVRYLPKALRRLMALKPQLRPFFLNPVTVNVYSVPFSSPGTLMRN